MIDHECEKPCVRQGARVAAARGLIGRRAAYLLAAPSAVALLLLTHVGPAGAAEPDPPIAEPLQPFSGDVPPSPSGVVKGDPRSAAPYPQSSPQSLAPAFGVNVRMNQDATGAPQNETSIAINPGNSSNIVAGGNDYRTGPPRSGFYATLDGGSTWTDGILPNYPAGAHPRGDPAVAFDSAGNAYFASLAFPNSGSSCQSEGGIYVSRSGDGGLTWAAPLQVAQNSLGPPIFLFLDKEYIGVDRTSGPFAGQVYVSMTLFVHSAGCTSGYVSSPIVVATLTPDAASVKSLVQIGGGTADLFSQGSVPAVDLDGKVYVAYQTFDSGCPVTVTQLSGEGQVNQQKAIHVASSTDGGATFGTPVTAACQFGLPFSTTLGKTILPPTVFRMNSFPSMAVNPANGHIYIVWTEWVPQTDSDVFFIKSTDRGASWSAPIRVNDDTVGNGKDQFFPWVSVSPNGARIDVVFYDRRDDSSNISFHTYVSSSHNSGASFTVNQRVSTVASNPADDGFGGAFIGDYNAIASTVDALHVAWTDTRAGEADVYYARVEAPAPPTLPSASVWGLAGMAATLVLLLGVWARRRARPGGRSR